MAFWRNLRRSDEREDGVTTPRELWGWYSYGMAAEVFAVCGVGSFLPVTLEQLARENGVLRSDGVTPCIQPQVSPALDSRGLFKRDEDTCVVHLLGAEINTSSFALYSFSLAVFVQTIMLISIGAIADYGGNRKQLLLIFSFIGASAAMLFILVFPSIYILGQLFTVISIACLGSCFVLLNSFLPLLVANHPTIRKGDDASSIPLESTSFENDLDDLLDDDIEADGLLQTAQPQEHIETDKTSPALLLSNQISSKGVALGYSTSVFVQIIGIGILVLYTKLSPSTASSSLPMRTVLFVVGLWWACFTVPTALWLRKRPGPQLPLTLGSQSRWPSWFGYISFAWMSLFKTIKVAYQLRHVVMFLIGWFMLSDAIATIDGTAILFARTELKMKTELVALLSITATASGIVGASCWPIIARRYKLSSIQIVICCVCLFEIIPLYGLLGFVPFIKAWGVIGLQQPWEVFPLAFILGFVMGGISSYCRSLFGQLIPPGMESAFYALYAVTDKGSSVIGPAIVGRIIDATGTIRMAFWFLSVLMIAPVPFFLFVNVEKGREDGLMMARKRSRAT